VRDFYLNFLKFVSGLISFIFIYLSVSRIKMNRIGQFVIGTSSNVTYDKTIDFIAKNQAKSVLLFKEYSKYVNKSLFFSFLSSV
jgi:hypothetical protein